MIPVILAGGSGTRLWPLSRALHPKQLLALHSTATLIQETVLRLRDAGATHAPIIVCNEEHRFMVAGQLEEIGMPPQAIILEPMARGTAPAIAAAALDVEARHGDEIIAVFPADHVIENTSAFGQALAKATALAEQGRLVAFGITPQSAHPGYGYIRLGGSLDEGVGEIAEFVEKPDAATAEAYLKDGGYFWNGGMFVFRASTLLAELGKHSPGLLGACTQAYQAASLDLDFVRLDEKRFAESPSDSIDYALMEKVSGAMMVALDAGWNDIGSWSSLWEIGDKDNANNVVSGDVIMEDTRNTLILSEHELVATVGIDNLVVIDTPDALLVAHQDRVDAVKQLVDQLKASGRYQSQHHRKVYRPWGSFDSIDRGEHFQVKHITVNPGKKLSLQKHQHRAEHWVVVCGSARVTVGEESFTLAENESTYIPIGVVHRLENPTDEPLKIIEVQSGSYLGEDDIVRLEDDFNRPQED